MSISSTLKNWYLQNKRDLPWRNTLNPYHIWVSEVILQQTRILQGLPYYYKFIREFPDVESLANAPQDKLLKIWQGLGYYSRARNMQKGAQLIIEKFNGHLPADYNLLLSINGIGEYTASAIASFAFNLPFAVVDGNVNRVISRLYGVFEPVNELSGKRKIQQIASDLIDKDHPGLFNQSIMEFGALQCTPNKPDCAICVLNNLCYAYQHSKVKELPVKTKKLNSLNRYFCYLVLLSDQYIFLRERKGNDIWRGLYEFPLIETEQKLTIDDLLIHPEYINMMGSCSVSISGEPVNYMHKLTHRNINACFIKIYIKSEELIQLNGFSKIPYHNVWKYPTSRLIHKYMEEHLKDLIKMNG